MTHRNVLMVLIYSLCSLFISLESLANDQICHDCLPKLVGDIVHRNSNITSAFVGHAGVVYSWHSQKPKWNAVIYHIMPGYNAAGEANRSDPFEDATQVRGKSLIHHSFMGKFPLHSHFWGAKQVQEGGFGVFESKTSRDMQKHLASFADPKLASFVGIEYDTLHLNQKGRKLKNGRWEFDCVGFVEHVFESKGFNPTPDEYESGLGWPLTVREQRESINLFHGPKVSTHEL